MAASRTYELKRRAERQEETRRRIVAAAVELHTTLGPARTTVQAIAEQAGVTRPTVYAHFPDARSLAAGDLPEVEELVRTTGFYRNKARAIVGMSQALVAEHGGEVPADMAALVQLPGVGRKTANVILGNAFGQNEGIVVDTHVQRLSRRLHFTEQTDAEKIEADLLPLVAREDWTHFSHLLIDHGRAVCKARKPECPRCPVADLCPSAEV